MPFTLSHPLAAIPLRRAGLGVEALVIGSMVPDLVLFVRLPLGYDLTHSVLGILTVDLLLGLALLLVWRLLLRAPLTDAMPALVRERLPAAPRAALPRPRAAAEAALGVVLGAVTHVLWDSFTHSYGVAVRMLPVLRRMLGPLPVHEWLQYASSAIGLLGILVIAALALRAAPPRPVPRRCPRLAPLVALVPCVLGGLTAGAVAGSTWGLVPAASVLYLVATRSITLAGIALLACAALWWAGASGSRPVES